MLVKSETQNMSEEELANLSFREELQLESITFLQDMEDVMEKDLARLEDYMKWVRDRGDSDEAEYIRCYMECTEKELKVVHSVLKEKLEEKYRCLEA